MPQLRRVGKNICGFYQKNLPSQIISERVRKFIMPRVARTCGQVPTLGAAPERDSLEAVSGFTETPYKFFKASKIDCG